LVEPVPEKHPFSYFLTLWLSYDIFNLLISLFPVVGLHFVSKNFIPFLLAYFFDPKPILIIFGTIIQNNKLCILFPFTTVLCTLTTACSMSKFEFKQKYVQWKKSSQTTDKTVHIVAALPSIGCHRGLEPFTRLVNCFVND